MRTSIGTNKHTLHFMAASLATLCLMGLFLFLPTRAEAAVTYTDNTWCTELGAKGVSQMDYSGYNWWDLAWTTSALWVWSTDSGSWVKMDEKSGHCGGGSCIFEVITGPKMTGSPHTWIETASHTATFFSGAQYSDSDQCSCWY